MKRIGIILCLALSGCQLNPAGNKLLTAINPLNWGAGRAAKAVAKAEAMNDELGETLGQAALRELFKTGFFIRSALGTHPDNRALQLAARTNDNAFGILNQRLPLSFAETDEQLKLAQDLLSDDAATRSRAEAVQTHLEGENKKLSTQLQETRAKIDKLSKERDAEAAENLALATELRNNKLIAWCSTGASILLGLATIAYRLNIGRFQTAAANVLTTVTKKHGKEAGASARAALDAVLHTGEQKGVAKAFFSLTKA
jgi:hypothetical protein